MLQAIVKTAILGTERSFPEKVEFPSFLHEKFDKIMSSETTKEAKFLKLSALAFHIHQSASSQNFINEKLPEVPKEDKKYASKRANFILKNYIKKEDKLLIFFALCCFEKSEKLVSPFDIPALLDLAYGKLEWRETILNACGNRAQWLLQFNDRWAKVFDKEANEQKILKKQLNIKKQALETQFLESNWVEKLKFLENITENEKDFYHYLQLLLTDKFEPFSLEFSVGIFHFLQNKHCTNNREMYQRLALQLHSGLKSDLMEQTNLSYQSIGIYPNIAREMLEILMDRDDLINL